MSSRFPVLRCTRLVVLLLGLSWLANQAMAQDNCKEIRNIARSSANADQPIIVTMMDLRENPEAYYGKTVTVDGELNRTFTDNAFTIEGGDFGHDFDVLVVSTASKAESVTPKEGAVDKDKDVRVTGVVEPYDRDNLECAYGPLHLEGNEGRSFTKSPVLIIDRTSESGTEREKPAPDAPATTAPIPPAKRPY